MRSFLVLTALSLAASISAAKAERAISAAELESITGGQSTVVDIRTDQRLNATSENNRIAAETVETGAIRFEPGSLESFNGIGNFVLNTGNNNVLQGSIAVTVVNAAP